MTRHSLSNKEHILSVYLAGPMAGVSATKTKEWRWALKNSPRFVDGRSSKIAWLDPTRCFPMTDNPISNEDLDEYRGNYLMRPKTILARDYADVRRCDIVVAGLHRSFHGIVPVSIGTCIEIGWCHAFQKILLIIAEEDSEYRKHPMVSSIATSFVENLEEAEEFLSILMYEKEMEGESGV